MTSVKSDENEKFIVTLGNPKIPIQYCLEKMNILSIAVFAAEDRKVEFGKI